MSDFDSPWKEALHYCLKWFLAFFFPKCHDEIDWSREYESLDTELQKIFPEGETGKRTVDKLFKVWRRDGEEAWVLIHVEVQSQAEEEFAERIRLQLPAVRSVPATSGGELGCSGGRPGGLEAELVQL